jgi:hypothetical protein
VYTDGKMPPPACARIVLAGLLAGRAGTAMERMLAAYNKWTAYNLYLPMAPPTEHGMIGVMRWLSIDHCPMCSDLVTSQDLAASAAASAWDRASANGVTRTKLHRCMTCGWWGIRDQAEEESIIVDSEEKYWDTLISGVVQKWDASSKSAPVDVLMEYFRRRDLLFHEVHPFAFEKIIAECLKTEFGPCEVRHVGSYGGKGDRGIDAFVVKDGVDWIVQIKRRSSDGPESVDAVRMLNGVLFREGKTHGIVITTAPRFTKGAQLEAHPRVSGSYVVKLLTRQDVLRMIDISVDQLHPAVWEVVLKDQGSWANRETVPDEIKQLLGGEETKDLWYPG